MKLLSIDNAFLRRTQFPAQKRSQAVVSSSVKVDPAHALKIFVKRFAGVFFQMGAGEGRILIFPARRRNDRISPPCTIGSSNWLIW